MTTATAAPSARRMTRAQFAAKHPDFKATIDGRPFVLADCGEKGTCLVPVELSEAPVFREVCGWCKAVVVEGDAGAPVTHGICPTCAANAG